MTQQPGAAFQVHPREQKQQDGNLLGVYSDFHDVNEAIGSEKRLKGWSRAKKIALIENDWTAISSLARNAQGRRLITLGSRGAR